MSGNQTRTRRRWLGTCAGVAGTATLAGCFGSDTDENDGNENDVSEDQADAASSTDWPMYGVDLQNTAHHPDVVGLADDEVVAREVIQTDRTGLHPITIYDGILYGNNAGESIYALDLETETIEWKGDTGGSTVVHNGTVYGPISNETLYGYDAESGKRWSSERNNAVDAFVTHPLPTENGILIASNEVIWRFNPDGGEYTEVVDIPPTHLTTDWPAFAAGTLYIGRSAGLHAINIDAREIKWTFEPPHGGSVVSSNPAVADNTVYVLSSEERLYAINADSGTEEWEVHIGIAEGSPAVADGIVYLTGSRSIVAVDADSGTIIWESGDDIALDPYDAVIADEICHVVTSFRMWGYDAYSGDLVWKYERPDDSEIRFSSPPTVFDGRIYVPSSDNTLYSIENM